MTIPPEFVEIAVVLRNGRNTFNEILKNRSGLLITFGRLVQFAHVLQEDSQVAVIGSEMRLLAGDEFLVEAARSAMSGPRLS